MNRARSAETSVSVLSVKETRLILLSINYLWKCLILLRRAPRHRFPNTQHPRRHFPFRKPVSGQRGSRRLIVQIGLQIMPASRHHSPYLSRAPAFRKRFASQFLHACEAVSAKMRLYFHSVSRPIFQFIYSSVRLHAVGCLLRPRR